MEGLAPRIDTVPNETLDLTEVKVLQALQIGITDPCFQFRLQAEELFRDSGSVFLCGSVKLLGCVSRLQEG